MTRDTRGKVLKVRATNAAGAALTFEFDFVTDKAAQITFVMGCTTSLGQNQAGVIGLALLLSAACAKDANVYLRYEELSIGNVATYATVPGEHVPATSSSTTPSSVSQVPVNVFSLQLMATINSGAELVLDYDKGGGSVRVLAGKNLGEERVFVNFASQLTAAWVANAYGWVTTVPVPNAISAITDVQVPLDV